ncbi:MAG: hypothetical protein MJ237_06385 [bacterium]|nr:hypothetical protein [bacterium]
MIFCVHTANAYEDCMIFNKYKLTDIKIEDNSIIDVYPVVTIMNDKSTLIVHPLKAGQTRFCLLKNNKDVVLFNVKVDENGTYIDETDGFDIMTLDIPDGVYDFEIDLPPFINGNGTVEGLNNG